MDYKHVTTLRKRIDNCKNGMSEDLTEDEKEQLFNLVSCGCRTKNKERLASKIFNVPLSCWENFYRYDRVDFDLHDNKPVVSYCAGQDYTYEIRELRDLILGKV